MTHDELVERAGGWLRRVAGCKVVMTELSAVCRSGEIPDAIGWREAGTVLVEAKASRGDFLADRNKAFRRDPSRGMGALRYYMAPAGLIKVEELPDRWGLLEVNGRRVMMSAGPDPRRWDASRSEFWHDQRATDCETSMLLSGLNRIRISMGDGEFRRVLHMRFQDRQAELLAGRQEAA
ncbi:hypothetical protein SAMN02800692_2013 [Luteibacter sp. UNC138MFCol5.1]|uniref:hypothetical protein n=1 Tax=Luteibacter sp. UNC138MFCol5.1 TaxID=1502774 RepID=UPI0008D2A1FA|nr:hypothetical protein [Luteibacter sp. UNC138MFCol5.1]SEO76690.1 hypothetical protein SAMN02800692_2013 [Luteibacter sp. UNC138MFCol5.1]